MVIYFVSILKVRIAAHEHTEWILRVSHNGAQAGIALDILVSKAEEMSSMHSSPD